VDFPSSTNKDLSAQTIKAEYDTPVNLLRKQSGLFRSMVDESNDRDKLYEVAFQRSK
jgi:hypothetical protein